MATLIPVLGACVSRITSALSQRVEHAPEQIPNGQFQVVWIDEGRITIFKINCLNTE